MIQRVYIILLSGICVYHLDFASIRLDKEKAFDPQLLSGFFTAIMEFANTATGGGYESDGSKPIDTISISNRKYYISKNHKFYYVIEADQLDSYLNNEDMKEIIGFIQRMFSSKADVGANAAMTGEMYIDEDFGNVIKEHVSRTVRSKLFHNTKIKTEEFVKT